MNSDARHHSFFSRSAWALSLALCLGLLITGEPAFGVGGTPASPPPGTGPDARWNSSSAIQPAQIMEDFTWFAGHSDPKNGDTRLFYAVDIENGMLFAATGQGLQIVDVRGGPTATEASYIYGYHLGGSFPGWTFAGDADWFVTHLDAPEGNPNILGLSMDLQGFSIVNTSNPAAPVVAYHATGPLVSTGQVHSLRVGSTDWAYALTTNSQVIRFNMTAASGMNRCHEVPPLTTCAGVYNGVVSGLGSGWTALEGTGSFLTAGKWQQGGLIKIWKVTDAASPTEVLQISGAPAMGLAMWKQGSSHYLARVDAAKKLWIHDVSCIASGTCSSAPVVWSQQLTAPSFLKHVTASQGGGRTYLYVGGDDLGSCVAQREYLFDVTNPETASHDDLTPKINPSGYWGWYYQDCPTGFNLVGPRIGKVYTSTSGTHLYRAAMSILDAHKVGSANQPPTADFSWTPSEVYPGTEVDFTDLSSGSPNSWDWTFQDGTPGGSSVKNPQNVTFSGVGQKAVTLNVASSQNGPGTPAAKNLVVLDPTPQLTGVNVTPASPTVCQPVTMTAVSPSGQPPLAFQWKVKNSAGGDVFSTSNGNTSQVWDTTSASAGAYTAELTLSNGTTTSTVTRTKAFTLAALQELPLAGQFTPTTDPFTAGTVTFHVTAPGATAWNWDFDGDGVFNESDWTDNPTSGPNPTHSYATIGTRQVRVKVRNCQNLIGVISAPVTVNVTQITPLAAIFGIAGGALCFPGTDICSVDTGVNITFLDASTGAEKWFFDWNGNNVYVEVPSSAFVNNTIKHAYTAAGNYRPKLKVTRGSEQHIYTLPQEIQVSQSGPVPTPAISISGPSSGQVNAALTFTASGSGGCNPSASGWTWNLAGGTATGGTNGSSVTVSWSSAGSKALSASNSACSVTGNKSVNITPVSSTTLTANFTFSPATPAFNQAVSFNGASSTGTPESYTWSFGDGTGLGTGAQVSHTFAQAGSYQVKLTVAKQGTGPGCQTIPGAGSICSAEITKLVVVSGAPPLIAGFTSDICNNVLGLCTTDPGKAVTFTDASTGNIVSRNWDFGDGGTATGTTVTHTYTSPGTYQMTLTISDGTKTNSSTRTIVVNGVLTEAMLLPWIGKAANGPLLQTSDLYLHNPSTESIDVTLEFRQRGNVGTLPPVLRTIAPNATLFVSDVVKSLFGLDNMTGFLAVKINRGSVQPVLMSFNTTFRGGAEFGQTIPGFLQSNTGAAATTGNNQVQHLVGLNDNDERLAYFGFSNPLDSPVNYTLRFFDNEGNSIGTGGTLTLGRFGAKQFQTSEIKTRFGLTDQDDYRVTVETPRNAQLFPYGANVRLGSADPSFLTVGKGAARTYLLGALSTPGANNSVWRSDLVLANTGTEVVIADISFTNVGATSQQTDVVKETLQPGETRRLADVIGTKWNIHNGVGVLTIDSNAPGNQFPVIQGESYENTNPAKRYGQTLPGLTDAMAAGTGQGQYLVGLREDAKYRTTFWLFNPGTQTALYDVVFRNLQGQEVHRIPNVGLGAGKLRQLNKAQFPTVTGGFTVQVIVKQGKGLAAAQVVNNVTNDPAYVQGETR